MRIATMTLGGYALALVGRHHGKVGTVVRLYFMAGYNKKGEFTSGRYCKLRFSGGSYGKRSYKLQDVMPVRATSSAIGIPFDPTWFSEPFLSC